MSAATDPIINGTIAAVAFIAALALIVLFVAVWARRKKKP